jgi:hypothetical protein
MTKAQREVVARLVAKGWEPQQSYRRCIPLYRPRTMWTKRCPIRVTPTGRILRGFAAGCNV